MKIGSAADLDVSEQVSAFYGTHWKRPIALANPSFYDWQFRQCPDGDARDAVCVAVRDGELIGAMGLNERKFCFGRERLSAAELTTWVVSPKARGSGAGRAMVDYLTSRYEVLLGAGITDDALAVYLRSGFNFVRHLPRYFRVYNLEELGELACVEPLGRKLAEERRPSYREVLAEQVNASDLGRDLPFNCFARDPSNLAWRYDRHPVFKYEAYRIGGSGVILRRDRVQEFKFGHIVELLLGEDWQAVLSFVDTYAIKNELAAIDCTITTSSIAGKLIAAGWFSVLDEPHLQYSNLFHPPEFRTPQTTSLIYFSKGRQAQLADIANAYITKGDLDLDRPTMHYYEVNGLV